MNQIERDKLIVQKVKDFFKQYADCFVNRIVPCDIGEYILGVEAKLNGVFSESPILSYNKMSCVPTYGPDILTKFKDRIIFYKTNCNSSEEGFATFVIQYDVEVHLVVCFYWELDANSEVVIYGKIHAFYKDINKLNQFTDDVAENEVYIEYEKSSMGFT